MLKAKGGDGGGVGSQSHSTLEFSFSLNFLDFILARSGVCLLNPPTKGSLQLGENLAARELFVETPM